MSVHPWKTVPARGERFDRLMSTSFLPATISALPVKIFRVGCSMPKAATMKKPRRHLTRRNPLPSCMGRVCYHTCEGACNRGKLDASVGINSVERFLGDNALENGYKFQRPEQKTGKQVLIVGSGPAGLSAAYQLALKGPRCHDQRRQPGSRRHDALRYPKLPLPQRETGCRD